MNGVIWAVSRLTFHSKVTTCWQKQVRDKYSSEGLPPVPALNTRKAIIRRVSRKLASQIILKYEWLGTMAPTGYHYGIFFGNYCAGVCCYGAGGATGGVNSHMPFGIDRNELATLARGACVHWAPGGANSKLVSFSLRLLAKDTRCKVAIAYSDTDAGEIGTIYQASNWVYIGLGASTKQWVSPDGRIMDQKLPSDLKRSRGGERQGWVNALRRAGWTEQPSNPKHRYVFLLNNRDKLLKNHINGMSMSYPKRADN